MVVLTRDMGFAVTLLRKGPDRQPVDWDVDSTPVLDFGGGARWVAALDGNRATFAEPAASVNAAITSNEGTRSAALMSGQSLWARGRVEVYG